MEKQADSARQFRTETLPYRFSSTILYPSMSVLFLTFLYHVVNPYLTFRAAKYSNILTDKQNSFSADGRWGKGDGLRAL